jgi:magnesium transporter
MTKFKHKGSARNMVNELKRLLEQNEKGKIRKLLNQMDFHEIAKVLGLSRQRMRLFRLMPPDLQAEVIFAVSIRVRKNIIRALTQPEVDALLYYTDTTEEEVILQYRDEDEKEEITKRQEISKKEDVSEIFQSLPESAGELVNRNFIVVREDYMVEDVAAKVDEYLERFNDVPVIIATDRQEKVLGRIFFAHIIGADAESKVDGLISDAIMVKHQVDRELLIHLLRKNPKDDLIVVTNEDSHPLGVVHAKDLLGVVEAEQTEDFLSFAGLHEDEHAVSSVKTAFLHRYRWLILNLFTLTVAASVVSIFEKTLDELVILAIYMPIVAGMSGNAGTQAMAIVIRGLAVGEIEKGEGRKVVLKEGITGLLNGLVTGVIMAALSSVWHGNIMLGAVLGVSMMVSLFAAGIIGTIIPILLRRVGVDPAVSSSVFLTTLTDIIGFLVFLSLASIILL